MIETLTVLRMRRDLKQAIPNASWPEGVRLAPFIPAESQRLHALLVRSYQAGFGYVASHEVWWKELVHDAEFDSNLCLVAKNGSGRIVGLAQCWTSGFVKDLVVHPLARRKGLGAALLNTAFIAFRRRGLAHVDLKVQANNAAAIALYRRVGMAEVEEV